MIQPGAEATSNREEAWPAGRRDSARRLGVVGDWGGSAALPSANALLLNQSIVAKLQRPSIYTRMLLTTNFYPDNICLEACSTEDFQGHHVVGLAWMVGMSINRGALKPIADPIFELKE